MKPEQRLAKIRREIDGRGIWKNAAETDLLIARALRAERRAALNDFEKEYRRVFGNYVDEVTIDILKGLKSPAPSKRKGSAGMQHFAKFLESTGHLLEVQNRKPTKVRASVAFDNEHARGTISGEAVGKPSKRKAGRK